MLMRIAIIGGGIIGLYSAWQLAKKRHGVVVFEKKKRIGKEACSGLFSERILSFLPQSRALVQNRINSVLIHFPRKDVNVRFSRPFLVMDHCKLDKMTATLARKAGVKIMAGKQVSLRSIGKFDKIIGCDGAYSAVRENLGLKKPSLRLGMLGFIPQKDNSDYVETWPVKNGFLWRIPRGKSQEYGIMAGFKEASVILKTFLKEKNIKIKKIISGPIPQGLAIPRTENITLCGDALGLTKAWSGGGVVWGLLAASMLLNKFPDFTKYHKAVRRFFLPKIIFSKLAVKAVYFLGFNLPWLLPKNVKIESDFLL